MFFIFLLRLSYQSSCDYTITSDIGMSKVDRDLSLGETLCINITYYPFYISFYDLSPSVEYNEYYSISTERINPIDFFFNGSELLQIGFRSFELPYGSITFTARESASHVSFTYFSMPGLCTTGIYFCRSSNDHFVFTKNSEGFFKLRNYDDKCVIFIPPIQTVVQFKQQSADQYDQIYIYKNFTDYYGFSGSFPLKEFKYTENETNMIRILMNSDQTPEQIELFFNPLAMYSPLKSSYFIPRHKEPECEVIDHWYSEELIITLIVCCIFFLILIIIVLICRFRYSCKQKDKSIQIRTIQ